MGLMSPHQYTIIYVGKNERIIHYKFKGKTCLSLFNMPIVLMILLAILFMWLFQFKQIKIIYTFNVCPIYLQYRRFDFLLRHMKYHKFSFFNV